MTLRFPRLSQLDREQRAVYNDADPSASILVIGAPGTGKTVMAFHRGAVLQEMEIEPRVIMYNKVLSTFVSAGDGPAAKLDASTMHSWVYGWWRKVKRTQSRPPMVLGNEYQHDWGQIMAAVAPALADESTAARAGWGHLIVDEGQDFPESMYQCLNMLSTLMASRHGIECGITVFADDNQRLNPHQNSTLDQIKAAMGLNTAGEQRVFRLRKNHRNTAPIAEFASHYYVGLQSGIAEPPSRKGAKPVVYTSFDAMNLEPVRNLLTNYARNNPGKEIGVLCPGDNVRRKVFNSLSRRLSDTGVRVQTYANADRLEHPADALEFDRGDIITVLNFQSAKGLEFDAVFIVDPFSAFPVGGGQEVAFRMMMYVMASRARESLYCVLLTKPPRDEFLPPRRTYDLVELT